MVYIKYQIITERTPNFSVYLYKKLIAEMTQLHLMFKPCGNRAVTLPNSRY